MPQTEVKIPTPDGEARAFTFTPGGEGPWPAVIFFMDAPAIRPALFQMCERLASSGYFVLLPDMFWRAGPYPPIDIKAVMKSEEARRTVARAPDGVHRSGALHPRHRRFPGLAFQSAAGEGR